MKVGGRRRITIPPHLAYGKRGAGGVIGPDETLVFVVDLVGVRWAALAAREHGVVAVGAQDLDHDVAVVALQLDDAVLDRAADAAALLQAPGELLQAASSSGTSATVVTALPRRPLVSRRTFTRPPAAIARLELRVAGLAQVAVGARPHDPAASRLGIRATVAQGVHRRT